MKAEEFFKKQKDGEYDTPICPKEPDWRQQEYLISNDIPQFINENRSVKWNREKRKEMINEKLELISNDYYRKKQEFYEMDKDVIVKYHEDRMGMFVEEFEFNEEQIYHIFKEMLDINLYHFKMYSKDFEQIKKIMANIKKVIELG